MQNISNIFDFIRLEKKRQDSQIELIASENIVSKDVLLAMGSVLTNKYAEGYSGRRYYGGCEFVDMVEMDAIKSICQLFGCQFANVQPHSGAQANLSAYYATVNVGDTILGMNLACGGHLTHGARPTISGKWFNAVQYGVSRDTGLIDYDEVQRLAEEHSPKIIVAGASAYPRTIDFKRFSEIAKSVGAYLMADVAHYAGLIVAGLYPNPFPYADIVTSTTHKTLRGPRGGIIMTNDKDLAVKIDKAVFPGVQGGPLMHVIAGKAVAFQEALSKEFNQYALQVLNNAKAFSKELMRLGIDILTGGTDSHMVILDLRSLGISGADAEVALEKAGLTCNKNAIPFDPLPVTLTSGIRLGTPAGTSRGMKEQDFEFVAQCMYEVLCAVKDNDAKNIAKVTEKIRGKISTLCASLKEVPSLL